MRSRGIAQELYEETKPIYWHIIAIWQYSNSVIRVMMLEHFFLRDAYFRILLD